MTTNLPRPLPKLLKSLFICSALAIPSFANVAVAAEEVGALSRSAVSTELGPRSFLLGAAKAGDRIVVAGERGIILLSDDNGDSWKQAPVPVSVTLTGVRFADSKNGFAIGNGGTVLSTDDAGESWTVRLDGKRIANIVLEAAKETGDDWAIGSAERMVADGPDKPILDINITSADQLTVVGAYGIALTSNDGGETWRSFSDRFDNPGGMHIYTIRREANRVVMAGEMGFVWVSTDGGQQFESITTPYEGSFFTAELLGNETIVLAGLRGNVWRSDDNGADWSQLRSPVSATITGSMKGEDGQLLMVNKAGLVMGLKGNAVIPVSDKKFPPLNNLLQKDNGDLLVVSARGLMSVKSGDLK